MSWRRPLHAGERDAWIAAGAALAVCLIAAQATPYAPAMWTLGLPVERSPQPAFTALVRAAEGLGLSPMQAGRLLCALGTALAAWAGRTAFAAWGLPRARANLAVALMLCGPTAAFFATSFHAHAAALGASAVAVRLALASAAAPIRAPLAAGVATAVAAALDLHATIAAPLVFGLIGWHGVPSRWWPPLSRARAVALAVAAHVAATAILCSAVAGSPPWSALAGSGDCAWLDFLARDWFRPHLPLSVVAVAGLLASRTRRVAWATLLLLAPAWVLHAALQRQTSADGGGTLPLLLPAAVVAARLFSWRGGSLLLSLGVVLASGRRVAFDDSERIRAFGRGLAAAAGGHEVALLIGQHRDAATLYAERPRAPTLALAQLATIDDTRLAAALAAVQARIDAWIGEGRRVYLTEDAEAELRDRSFRSLPACAAIVSFLEARYQPVPICEDGFCAKQLLPPDPR